MANSSDDTSVHTLDAGEGGIPYRIRTSGRATRIRIDVDPDGVRVIMPEGHSGDPHAFIREKSEWVRAKYKKYEEYREQIPDRRFEEGASFPFLGDERTIGIEDRAYSVLTSEQFVLARDRVRETSIREELEHLYRREARKVFEEKTQKFAQRMGVKYGTVAVRDQKTRWGSCSPKDTLSFNWRVVLGPEAIVDYLVVHELAHLKERNHTRQFWNIVAEHDPDWENHARWLKENSALLVFDA